MPRPEDSPWAISVMQVASRPGQSEVIDSKFPAPSGIGDNIIGVDEGDELTLKGSMSSIVDGLILSGTITAPVHAECTRCLKPISRDWDVNVTVFFPYESKADSAGTKNGKTGKDEDADIVAGEEESEDMYPLSADGNFADVEALLRDALVEALPLQPLCREDCLGLCSQCGFDMNDDPDHHHDVTDGRFDVLAQLKAQLEQEQHKA
ncbi:YceD family protein [Bifidobacterium tsurumiense]|uniref:Putative metal-binding, possibly nucleic acid-binding protein n=1 Tax=Bifidobacterium tsurumiense TaxID=356829 RepID=A0A087EK98_9BIFI|nr:DUF177 domain-containing protein [Bifidobacterium tsurumiense]KFJ08199.1 putative metal-binding, possibly nucleic acid-binding protein [Bifidobacterium tsurumiense]MDY4677418.1 DUF177 domain-containing protein [Bifidobacterium tsurumiense]